MGGWRQRCAAGLIIQYYRYSFKGPASVHRTAGTTVAVAVGLDVELRIQMARV